MPTRINGFSGMDIDSLVEESDGSQAHSFGQAQSTKAVLQWQRESYREMNSKIFDFKQNKLADTFIKSASMNTQQAVVTGNTEAVKAEATVNA